jgi:ABC-type branched-subunit amino acid transport system substrate-binding protein
MTFRRSLRAISCFGLLLCAGLPAHAQETYKIGVSVGLTGYAAAADRAWRDGLQVAVDDVNARGGVMGRKLELVVEDNKSEPEEAVTVYRKMIESDKVDIFISGCVSAGNFAAALFVVRAQTPMVLCSILPPRPDLAKWAFSFLAPPRFDVQTRLAWLTTNTEIRKVGILHDLSPYGDLMKDVAVKIAPDYHLDVAAVEQYKQNDADLSPQLTKMSAAGVKAIFKMGIGGSTITAARNIKQLGLDTLLLGNVDDRAVVTPAAEALGKQFVFVAAPAQIYDTLPESGMKEEIAHFLTLWRVKQGDRDPFYACRAWDALRATIAAIEQAQSFEGPKVRDAFESLPGIQGTSGVYLFSPRVHQGITENPFVMGTIANGKMHVVSQ